MLNEKDGNTLINKANKLLVDLATSRVRFEKMPLSVCAYLELHKKRVNGAVVIIRSRDDEAKAAQARNTIDKILFVFADIYWNGVPSYFSGVTRNIPVSMALIKRAEKET